MNESYVNLKQGKKDIVFEDAEVPAVTDKKLVIPRRMRWVVSIAIPMDLDLLSRAPTSWATPPPGSGTVTPRLRWHR